MRVFLVKLILHTFALLPLPLNHALGFMIGLLLHLVPNRVRSISQINIRLCLPELNAAQQARLLRKSLTEMGKSVTEMGPLWLWKPERLMRKIHAVHDIDILEQAQAQGKGVIILTPHLGSWELTSLQFAQHWPVTCLYRPPRMAELEAMLCKARERSGATLVPTDVSGVKALYAALARQQAIGILPDQDPGKGGSVLAPFFGTPAYTIKLVARLIHKSKAPVIATYAKRLPYGRGYTIHYKQADEAIYASDPLTSVMAMNRLVEACVRDNIEQYQWSYKRFKSRPEGEQSPYQS